ARGDAGEKPRPLGDGEGAADTAARAAAERKVSERQAARARCWPEAVGIEAIGRLPHRGITVGDIGTQQDERAGPDPVAAALVVLEGRPRRAACGWVDAQDLLDHSSRVVEAREIVGGGDSTGENVAAFLLDPPSDVRMLRKRVPGPRQRAGRGRMPGEEEGLQLVVELGVARGIEEGREQRAGWRGGG